MTPDAGEGPFYFDPSLVRSDVTSGRLGAPLEFAVQITRARDCAPWAGVRLDLWQADALGLYSGYRDQPGVGGVPTEPTVGATFLRGTQFADADGWVRFKTVYQLVRRPHAAHSFQGADRREGEGREPDLLPRRNQCRSVGNWDPYREHIAKRTSFNHNDTFLDRNADGHTDGVFCEVERYGRSGLAAKAVVKSTPVDAPDRRPAALSPRSAIGASTGAPAEAVILPTSDRATRVSCGRNGPNAHVARELRPGKPLGVRVAGTPVVLWRQADGTPAALIDRCPHRAPRCRWGAWTPAASSVRFTAGASTHRGVRLRFHGTPTRMLDWPHLPFVHRATIGHGLARLVDRRMDIAVEDRRGDFARPSPSTASFSPARSISVGRIEWCCTFRCRVERSCSWWRRVPVDGRRSAAVDNGAELLEPSVARPLVQPREPRIAAGPGDRRSSDPIEIPEARDENRVAPTRRHSASARATTAAQRRRQESVAKRAANTSVRLNVTRGASDMSLNVSGP